MKNNFRDVDEALGRAITALIVILSFGLVVGILRMIVCGCSVGL